MTEPGSRGRAAGPAMRHGVMLEVNEYLVLDLVRHRGETTRPEIGTELGLSAATVSRIVRRLIDQGHVTEGPGSSTGGRPRSVVRFNPLAGCVIGVDLGGSRCHGLLADLTGATLAESTRPIVDEGEPFPALLTTIRALRRRARELGLPVAAVAVGVAAIVDQETGVASGGPHVHWDGFPIVRELGAVVDLPFVVDNDVNLAALAHAWRGDGRGRTGFVVLALGTGIGAAIVADGRLLRGRRSAAGEVGYLVLERSLLREHAANGPGALEELASGPAIVALAQQRLAADATPCALRSIDPLTPEAILAAAAAGDALASAIVDKVADDVAMAVIALAAVVDPEVIVLDGSVGRALAPWLDGIAALVARHLPDPPAIAISSLDTEATALGAVAAALQLARRRGAPGPYVDTLTVGGTPDAASRPDVA